MIDNATVSTRNTPVGVTLSEDENILMFEGEHYTRTSSIVSAPIEEMGDRELLVYIATSHREILSLINEVKNDVMPTVEALMSSPILRPFIGKVEKS